MQHLYLNLSYFSTLRKLQQEIPEVCFSRFYRIYPFLPRIWLRIYSTSCSYGYFYFFSIQYPWRYFIFSCVLNYCKLQYCCFKENKHHLNPWYWKKTSKEINCMNILGHTLIVFFIFIFSWGELRKGLGSMLPFACRGPR